MKETGPYAGQPSTDKNPSGNSEIRISFKVVNLTSATGMGPAACTLSVCAQVGTKQREVKRTSKRLTSFDRAQQEKCLREDTVQCHVLSVPPCPYTDACNISKEPEALAE